MSFIAAVAFATLSPLAPLSDLSDSTGTWGVSPEMHAKLVEAGRKGFVELRFQFAPYDPASGIEQNRWWRTRPSFGVVGSSRVDLQACKLEYSIVSPK